MKVRSIGNNFVYGRFNGQGASLGGTHFAATREYWTGGLFLPRDGDISQNMMLDYQDEFAFFDRQTGATFTLTPNVAASSGSNLNVFRDDTSFLAWNAATSPYPVVLECDRSSNPILANLSGTFSVAITFRNAAVADLPTNIKVEYWDGSAYITSFDGTPTFVGGGQVWVDIRRTSPAPSNHFQKIKVTLSGTNPVSAAFRIQRVMLYHQTADWDPWHLHRNGGTMYGTVLFAPTNTFDIGSSTFAPRDVYAGRQFMAADGSNGAPGYTFAADLDCGMYRETSNVIVLGTSTVPGLRINATPSLRMRSDAEFGWSATTNIASGADVLLYRDAAGVLALRNLTNAQAFRVYNTTDAGLTNYERLEVSCASSIATFDMQKAGTGFYRPMRFVVGGTEALRLESSTARLNVKVGLDHVMGTGSGSSSMLGTANVNTTAVGNVGTGEDDLITYTLPANALSANGKGVRITAWGTGANNVNAKTLKVYFGTQVILTFALTVSQANNWRVMGSVWRTGASTQDWQASLIQAGTASAVDAENGTATQTDTATIAIKCTGEATADNDIVQEGMHVEFIN